MFVTKFVEKFRKHILCPVAFLKNCDIYETICKNLVELDRPWIIGPHMCVACWISKSTDTHSIIFTAFPLQQWLHEYA
jgi:hypothetical protein